MANLVVWLLMPIVFGTMAIFAALLVGTIIIRFKRILENIFDFEGKAKNAVDG